MASRGLAGMAEIVAHHAAQDAEDFATFISGNAQLLGKRLLSRHYHSATLAGKSVRRGWVEPDLAPFPRRGGQQ